MRRIPSFRLLFPWAALSLSLLLGGCSQLGELPDEAATHSVIGKGTATLTVDLVRSNRGVAVALSTVKLFKKGDDTTVVGETKTDAGGYAQFVNIPAGTYNLVFSKAHSAGSAFYGAEVHEQQQLHLKVAQYDAVDPDSKTDVPRLVIKTPSALNSAGEVTAYQDLTAGQTFTDKVNVRAYTVKTSDTPPLMRYFLFSLVQFDDSGNWSDLRPADGLIAQDPGFTAPGEGSQDSGLVSLDASGLSGNVYLQVVGLDFNYNRVAYLIPVTLSRTAAAGMVMAPVNVQAVAYTLRERIDYLMSIKPDEPGSGSNVWVSVAWDAPAKLDGYQGFRILRSDAAAGPYQQVAFAGTDSCAAPAKNAPTRHCKVMDNTATLQSDHDYYYKVVAQGSNEATSETPGYTHVLPAFNPHLLTPGSEEKNVDILPTYTLKTNLPASATGFYMDLNVTDWLTGYGDAYDAGRLNFRRGLSSSGQNEFQGIINVSGTNTFVYRTSNSPDDNFIGYDAAGDILSIPHQYEFGPRLFNARTTALQAGHRYSWFLNKAYAYRLLDQTAAQSSTNPVVAYSVYSDPSSPYAVPGGARQQYSEVNEFTTRP